jgi:hypothetical protein
MWKGLAENRLRSHFIEARFWISSVLPFAQNRMVRLANTASSQSVRTSVQFPIPEPPD